MKICVDLDQEEGTQGPMEIIAVGEVPFRPQSLLLESPVSLSAASLQTKLKLSIISAKHSGRFKGRGPSLLVSTALSSFSVAF